MKAARKIFTGIKVRAFSNIIEKALRIKRRSQFRRFRKAIYSPAGFDAGS
jgi:hypothetical protein